jgi:hypothetical protein
LITEAETVSEAFANARDAMKALARARASLAKQRARHDDWPVRAAQRTIPA